MTDPRRYTTPLAFKAALEARIARRAREQGRTVNRLRQRLVMERFAVRVAETLDAVVLKGGLVMELRLDRARTTRDVDLRATVRAGALLAALQEAGRRDSLDHLVFEVARQTAHPTIDAEGQRYEGQRFRVAAQLAGRRYADGFGVDVVIGEPLVGDPQNIFGDDILDFIGAPRPMFAAYPVPTHIAEKLHALSMPRPRPNSRVKDLPDIALLAGIAGLDAHALTTALTATFAHRQTHALPTALPPPPAAWTPVYARMAAVDGLPWGTLAALETAVRAVLDPVLAGHVHDGEWCPEDWCWKP